MKFYLIAVLIFAKYILLLPTCVSGAVNPSENGVTPTKDTVRVADCYIYKSSEGKLRWGVELNEVKNKKTYLDWSITDKLGNQIASGTHPAASKKLQWETSDFGMQHWSDKTPVLYRVRIIVKTKSGITDSFEQPFGLRTITRDGTNLRLNGKLVLLRGAQGIGSSPLNPYKLKRVELEKQNINNLKNLGFNWVRFNKNFPSEAQLQAADEMGIMFQVEGTSELSEKGWEEALRRCRKHPSVIIYCGGNEETLTETLIEYLGRVAAIQKKLAPDALFNPMEAMPGVEYRFDEKPASPSDIVQIPFEHNATRLAALKKFSDVFGQYSWGQLSYSSVFGDWRYLDEKLAVYERPLLAHELGISGSYPNLDLENRYATLAKVPTMYTKSRENLVKAGMIDKSGIYYRNSSAWQYLVRKYNVEMARKSSLTTGYDMLGIVDVTGYRDGYPCGLMNEFLELKPGITVAGVRRFNAESVVLLDSYTSRNILAGNEVSYDAMSSLYGKEPIKEGRLDWWLTNGVESYSRSSIQLPSVEVGKIQNLGAIKFTAPKLKEPEKLTLHVRLTGGEYDLINDWDFWVFPKPYIKKMAAYADSAIIKKFGKKYPELSSNSNLAELKIVSQLDAGLINYINDGGKVLLLSANPFPSLKTTFQLMSAGRPTGNFATVITRHPLMDAFPHEGFMDWQFFRMMEGGSAVSFTNDSVVFDPIIEIASSIKLIIKQSNLFELSLGKGKLMVCSLNMDRSDAGTDYFFANLLNYVSGKSFKPRSYISIENLKKWIGPGHTTTTIAPTDMGDERHLIRD